MSNLGIRTAQVSDAGCIAMLSDQLGYPVETDSIRQRLEQLLPHPDHLVLVADSSGSVVGWTHAAVEDVLETGRHCEIRGLVVSANHRSHGIGRRLINAVEQWATQEGLSQISVRSNVLREESHPFYKRMGFDHVKTQHVYRKVVGPIDQKL